MLEGKLNINMINIVREYLLPKRETVKFMKNKRLSELLVETEDIYFSLRYNYRYDQFNNVYQINFNNKKIIHEIPISNWTIRTKTE